jgi:hypothetical protein
MAGDLICPIPNLNPAFDALLDILAAHLVDEYLSELDEVSTSDGEGTNDAG